MPAKTQTPKRAASKLQSNSVTETEDHILKLAQSCLAESPYYAIRQLNCSYHEGILILRGRLSSFYLKQIAQSAVRKVETGVQIDNRIEVEEY